MFSIIDEENASSKSFFKDGMNHLITNSRELIDSYFNERYSFYSQGKNSPILKLRSLNDGYVSYDLMPLMTFQTSEKSRKFYYLKQGANGGIVPKKEDATSVWIESCYRRNIDKIVFCEEGGVEEFNLFQGFPVESGEGEIPSIFFDMIEKSLCNGCQETFNYVLDYLAHIIQFPFVKVPVVLVFSSGQGVGKGRLFEAVMRKLLRHYYLYLKSSNALIEPFNKGHEAKLFTYIDEANIGNNTKIINILKSYTGSDCIQINEKHVSSVELPNFSRYIIATNDTDPIVLDLDDRRFSIIECSNEYIGNHEFFKKVTGIIESKGFTGNFMGFLSRRDLSNFNPHVKLNIGNSIPRLKIKGSNVFEFLSDLLLEHPKRVYLSGHGVHQNILYQEYSSFCFLHGDKPKHINAFWTDLKKVISIMPEASTINMTLEEGNDSLNRSRIRAVLIGEMRDQFCSKVGLSPSRSNIEDHHYEIIAKDDF